jgi:4-hydroxy-tetrahydrodipicolinate reductase
MSDSIRILISGGRGRMGNEVLQLIKASYNFTCAGIMDRQSQNAALDFPDFNTVDPDAVDIVIDFSSPDLFSLAMKWCVEHQKPMVSGTTGVEAEHLLQLQEAGKVIPILWAPNMSLGIAYMNHICRNLRSLSSYQFQLEETHHAQKKDKPSGTAILLQNSLKESTDKPLPPPIAIRGGGVFGIHKLHIMGEEETLTIEHTALNRRVFARGALQAAQWMVVNKKGPAVYKFGEVLGLSEE